MISWFTTTKLLLQYLPGKKVLPGRRNLPFCWISGEIIVCFNFLHQKWRLDDSGWLSMHSMTVLTVRNREIACHEPKLVGNRYFPSFPSTTHTSNSQLHFAPNLENTNMPRVEAIKIWKSKICTQNMRNTSWRCFLQKMRSGGHREVGNQLWTAFDRDFWR